MVNDVGNSDIMISNQENTSTNKNLVWWIIILFFVIIIIGIIIFVLVEQFERSQDQSDQLQQTVGGSCQTDRNCLPGLTCLNSVCTVPSSTGGTIGTICQTNNDCNSGLTCAARSDISASQTVCLALSTPPAGDIGSICNSDGDCLSSLTCESAVCRARINTLCTKLDDCVTGATACTRGGICTTQLLPAAGGTCSDLPCQSGLTCQSNLCRAQIGGSCQDDNGCPVGSGGCSNGICVSQQGSLNQTCHLPSTPCQSGLECDTTVNICKISDGSRCNQDQDCKSSSSCRIDNLIGRICQPRTSLHAYCNSNAECESGFCGDSRLLMDQEGQLQSLHRFQNNLTDIILEGNDMIMLLGDGNMMRETNRSGKAGRMTMIKNNIQLERLVCLGNPEYGTMIYGLSEGRLYELDRGSSDHNSWKWIVTDWAPSEINHLDCTDDGNYLWLQSPIRYPPPNLPGRSRPYRVKQYGYLYRLIQMDEPLALVRQFLLPDNIIRIYGRNDVSYLEVNRVTHHAIRYPRGDTIMDYHSGGLMSDGRVYKIGMDHQTEVRTTRLINDNPYIITRRRCLIGGETLPNSMTKIGSYLTS